MLLRIGRPQRTPLCCAAVAALIVVCSGASAPADAAEAPKNSAPMCWPSDKLAGRPTEDRIQRGGRIALWSPPKGTPISFKAIPPAQRGAIRRVALPRDVKLVALTFDLCEQPNEISGYQGGIVDFLRTNKVKATFFAGGKWMLSHRERTQQLMSDPLFEVGNHSWEHRNLRLLKGDSLVNEIEYAQLSYEQVRQEMAGKQCIGPDGRKPPYESSAPRATLFRFPFGACNDKSMEAVAEMGLKIIQWDVTSGDPAPGQTSELIVRKVLDRVKSGSIVIFHANGRGHHTQGALPTIVRALREQGYEFATVTELLARGRPMYSPTCFDEKVGDTDVYDGIAMRLEQMYERARQRALLSFGDGASKADNRSSYRPEGRKDFPRGD